MPKPEQDVVADGRDGAHPDIVVRCGKRVGPDDRPRRGIEPECPARHGDEDRPVAAGDHPGGRSRAAARLERQRSRMAGGGEGEEQGEAGGVSTHAATAHAPCPDPGPLTGLSSCTRAPHGARSGTGGVVVLPGVPQIRDRRPGQVAAHLGLVPREHSSGPAEEGAVAHGARLDLDRERALRDLVQREGRCRGAWASRATSSQASVRASRTDFFLPGGPRQSSRLTMSSASARQRGAGVVGLQSFTISRHVSRRRRAVSRSASISRPSRRAIS
jgi:hypothetical protein